MTMTKQYTTPSIRHSSIDQKQKDLLRASRTRTKELLERAEKLGLTEKRHHFRDGNKTRPLINS